MNEWRPISTAPTDGTRVLLFCPDSEPEWQVMEGRWWQRYQSWGESVWGESELHPTDWMPLPAPPSRRQ